MKILFKNVTRYTKEEMKIFQDFYYNKNVKMYTIGKIGLQLIVLILMILNIMQANWYSLIGIVAWFIILYAYLYNVKPKRKQNINKEQEDQEYEFNFSEEYVQIKDNENKEIRKVKYSQFRKVYETKRDFYMYIDKNHSLLINKDCFKIGSKENFGKFIKKKMKFKYKLEK